MFLIWQFLNSQIGWISLKQQKVLVWDLTNSFFPKLPLTEEWPGGGGGVSGGGRGFFDFFRYPNHLCGLWIFLFNGSKTPSEQWHSRRNIKYYLSMRRFFFKNKFLGVCHHLKVWITHWTKMINFFFLTSNDWNLLLELYLLVFLSQF